MAGDPYEALGVSRTASQDDIKKAYKRLVKTSHPDLHPDDPAAEARFKDISAAYELLKDPEQRARFDRGEIDAQGQERPERTYYRRYAGAGANPYQSGGFRAAPGGGEEEDLSDLFAEILRGRGGMGGADWGAEAAFGQGGRARVVMPGQDVRYRLEIPFLDSVLGGSARVTLPGGNAIEVQIPRGARDGQTLRLRGKGGPGLGGGPAGDAYVTLSVAPHPVFRREGDDIRVTLPVGIDEAVLGAEVEVPTISGPVKLRVPGGTSSGQVLRLRGKGVAPRGSDRRGDQLVEVRIVLPDPVDDDLARAIAEWRRSHSYDPRKDMKAGGRP